MPTETSGNIIRRLVLQAPANVAKGFNPPQPAIADVPTGAAATDAANAAAINLILAALRAQGIIDP